MPQTLPRVLRLSPKYLLLAGFMMLSLGAPGDDSCTFSAGGSGLCVGLALGPAAPMLHVGESLRIQVNADGCTASGGCPCAEEATAQGQWRSTDPGTATVDAQGQVTAIGPGKAAIELVPAGEGESLAVVVTVVP